MSPTVKMRPDPTGISVARKLICEYLGRGSAMSALQFAERHCASTPQVGEAFRLKTAVGAGGTGTSHNLDDLAPSGVGGEFFSLLQSASIFGRLLPLCRRAPFHQKFPKDVGTGSAGSWKGEGLPTPVARTTTDTITQSQYTASVIAAVTNELFKFGRLTEVALRDIVLKIVSRFVDGQLLDPSVSASATVKPASITNNAVAVTSAGTSAANVITDLAALIESVTTPCDSLRWILRPSSYAAICAKLAGVGYPTTPGFLLGIPCILSSTSPAQITLVDVDSIIVSYDEVIDVSIAREATLEMLDGSLVQDGAVGTGTSLVSLLQSGLVAIRADVVCAWQPAFENSGSPTQPSGVAYCVIGY